jgi:hypothetical protein
VAGEQAVRNTHTYAILEVSREAYQEIKAKLEAAGYADQFLVSDGVALIDMHGIALSEAMNAADKHSRATA